MKKLILSILFNLSLSTALASPYAGLSLQSNGFMVENVKKLQGFDIPMDNAGYNDIQTHVSGLIGYKFEELLPYPVSIEVNWLQNSNQFPINQKVDYDERFDSEIKFKIFSLNTMHHYSLSDTSSLIGIVGLNHSTFKFKQGELEDKDSTFGINLGAGLDYELFSGRVSLRPKVLYYIFPNIRAENVSIKRVEGMFSVSFDFIIHL